MLTDSHCHLDQVPSPEDAVAEAVAAGVGRIVAVSEDLSSMERVLRLRDRHPEVVVPALGIHPQHVTAADDGSLEPAFRFLERHLPDAAQLGEVGLDHKHATTPGEQARQQLWLDRQLELAAALRKPVNLHSRRCLRQVMDIAIEYRRRTGLGAQLHWFTHSKKLVRISGREGVFVSVGPAVLQRPEALEVAATVSPECLLLETDSPVPYGGESARPSWIPRVLSRLAKARSEAEVELRTRLEANFQRLLGDGSEA